MNVKVKLPEEALQYTFDFTDRAEMVSGDTLTGTPTVTASSINGSGSLTLGTPTISGTLVNFTISGGTLGDDYAIKCTVQTSAGRTIGSVGELRIRNVL